jgi:hypothetical protein
VANVSTNPLGFLFGSSNAEAKELTTDVVKIRSGTVLLSNKILQIRNIASVEVVSLAISFPWIAPLFILFGLWLLSVGGWSAILGLLIGAWGAYLIYYYIDRRNARGLLLLLNSGIGSSTLITGVETEFLKKIAETLYNIMTTGEDRNVDIFIDQKKITEVTIENVSNSIISTGAVSGDLVNRIN